jgi:hypothetical protein
MTCSVAKSAALRDEKFLVFNRFSMYSGFGDEKSPEIRYLSFSGEIH